MAEQTNIKTMDEYYQDTLNLLRNGDIRVKEIYLKKVYDELLENKSKLNKILDLNEGNRYRHIEKYRITNSRFEKVYPKTFRMIKTLAGNKEFDIVKNTIQVDKDVWKLSKFLTNEFNKGNYGGQSFMNEVDEELETSNNIVSRICDLTKERNLCISTNIYDLITSSTNSAYSSCYKIGGDYFNGNLSYMRDNMTVICYVYADDIHRKIGRDWCYIFPEDFKILMSNKQYGSIFKADRKEMRIYIGKKISEYKNVRSYWKMENVAYNSGLYFNARPDHRQGSVYFDTGSLSFSYHKFKVADKHKPVLEFKQARCLNCGLLNFHPSSGTCGNCYSHKYECYDCGTEMTEDDYIIGLDGNRYCFSCFDDHYFECECCGNTFNVDNACKDPEGYKVCRNCFDETYRICDECKTIVHRDNALWEANMVYCEDCFHKKYGYCDSCGEYYLIDEMQEGMCQSCYYVKCV